MADMIVLEGEITNDGKLIVEIPSDVPRGKVKVTLQPEPEITAQPELTPEEEAVLDAELQELLSDENLKGLGLTAEEIAKSPEIGAWADRTDIIDSAEFVAEMRRKTYERRMRRD